MRAASIAFKADYSRSLRLGLSGLAVASICLLSSLNSSHAADEVAGKALALRWCSSCHFVANDQPAASSASLPGFYDIAKDPDWTDATLATFLASPHPKMPDMSLGTIEITNLAAYIKSLNP